jgi:glycosyltransferase involved in cell wall biosynthesis
MNVLAWVPQAYDVTPGQRFRIEQWEPHLSRSGIAVTYSAFADQDLSQMLARSGRIFDKTAGVLKALSRRLLEAVREARADLVYIFREDALLGPSWAAHVLRARGIPFVFDFDDAVYVRYHSPANGPLSYLRFPGKTAALCRHARTVLAGNAMLCEYANRYNSRVVLVPTTIETDLYRPREPHAQTDLPVIGWSGSFSTVQYLDLVGPALQALARRRRFLLRVVGGTGVHLPGVEVECRAWRPETEVSDLSTFDVGLMPLPDDIWTRGKCGLKALQYMALGIPPVVSPVGVNREIVEHERSGFFAVTPEEWVVHLDRLLAEPDLRQRIGLAARRTVEERYSAAIVAPRVADVLVAAAA